MQSEVTERWMVLAEQASKELGPAETRHVGKRDQLSA